MASDATSRRDVRDLQRGLAVNALGYAAKLGMPILLALATRLYGAERWGVFVAGQAIVLLLARVCLLGLDKGMLWWAARHDAAQVAAPLRCALWLVTASSAAVTCVLSACAAWDFVPWVPVHQLPALRVVVLGLLPFVWSELLLHTSMAARRVDLQVAVRDTLGPLVQVSISLLAYRLGARETGLAWGFVVSQGIGCCAAYGGTRSALRGTSSDSRSLRLPRRLLRYAWPLWLADISNSLLLRLDMIVLTACVDATTLGVWGVVMQFANSLRQIRRAFDPLVTAICADIAARADGARLARTYSHATELVSLTQLPVFALLFALSPAVLPLYGPEFQRGTTPLLVLSGAFLLNGASGLAGLVINGYGRSGLTLANTIAAVVVEYVALCVLAPRYGLTGAALALGITLTLTNVAQLLEMRAITGSFNYTSRAWRPVLVALGSAGAACAAWFAAQALTPLFARVLACMAFLVTYATLLLVTHQRKRMVNEDAAPRDGSIHPANAS